MKYNLKPLLKSGVAIIDLDQPLIYFTDKAGHKRCRQEYNARRAVQCFCKKHKLKYSVEKQDKFDISKVSKRLIVKIL